MKFITRPVPGSPPLEPTRSALAAWCMRSFCLALVLVTAVSVHGWRAVPHARRAHAVIAAPPAPRLAAPPPPPPPKVKGSGYYVRPSAALERGGGFYVPGLEGDRLRLLVAVVLGVGLVLNRVLSEGTPVLSQGISEALGATGCGLLIFQVVSDEEEARVQENVARRAAAVARLRELNELSPALPAAAAERARWAAGALLRLTPACAVVWLSEEAGEGPSVPLLRFGRFDEESAPEDAPRAAAALLARLGGAEAAAVEDLAEERLPLLPASCASLELRRCGPGVLAVASERPAAFTATHQRWIGKMGRLLEQSMELER